MAVRPTKLLKWAWNAVSGLIVEPPAGYAKAGFPRDWKPPAEWFNALFNNWASWVDFLRGPRVSDWRRAGWDVDAYGGPIALAVDTRSADAAGATRYRYVIVGQSSGPRVAVSMRGDLFEDRTLLPVGVAGTVHGVACLASVSAPGGRWWLWIDNAGSGQLCWTWPDDGTHSSAVGDPAVAWAQATLPGGTSGVRALAARPGTDQVAALSTGHLSVSADGGTTWGAGTLGTHSGYGRDVVWSGTAWVAITHTGEVLRAASLTDTWKVVAAFGVGVDWRLATDGAGTVVAYQYAAGTVADLQVSRDDGESWTPTTTTLQRVSRVRWSAGVWLATMTEAPYLVLSQDLVSWTSVPVPVDADLPWALHDVICADGAWLATGAGWTVTSGRAVAPEDGTWVPDPTPPGLADADRLQGVPIDGTPPTTGKVLGFDGTKWLAVATATLTEATLRAVAATLADTLSVNAVEIADLGAPNGDTSAARVCDVAAAIAACDSWTPVSGYHVTVPVPIGTSRVGLRHKGVMPDGTTVLRESEWLVVRGTSVISATGTGEDLAVGPSAGSLPAWDVAVIDDGVTLLVNCTPNTWTWSTSYSIKTL